MNQIKQSTSNRENSNAARLFWSTISLSILFMLVGIYFVTILFRQAHTAVIYFGMAIFLSGCVSSLISMLLAIRGRSLQGLQIAFFAINILGIVIMTLFQGRALTASSAIGVLSAIIIGWLLPRQLKRSYSVMAASAFILMWLIEWSNPPWRVKLAAAPVGPIAAFVFILFLGGLALYQARTVIASSLRNKLLTSVLGITVLSVGILAGFDYYNTSRNLTTSAGNSLKSLANSQAADISNVLIQEAHILQSFDLSKVVQDGVDEVNSSYGSDEAANLQMIKALDQQWLAADAANNNNAAVVRPILNNEVASELNEFKATFPENSEVFVTDRYGALVAATNRTSDYYQADEDWWQAAYNNGNGAIYFGQPEFDESSHTFGIIMAVPLVEHGTNKVNGVVRTTLKINKVLDILSQPLLGGTVHTDIYLPGNQALAPEESTTSLRPSDPTALARLSSLLGNKTYDTFTLDGVSSVVSAAPVSTTDPEAQDAINKLGWTLIVDQSQADNLAPVSQQGKFTVLLALLILGLSAVAAYFFSQSLSRPITHLTEFAQKVSSGNITAQAEVESNDEIGTLAATFNDMTAQLSNSISTLEQRVAARTRNLELAAEVGRAVSQVRSLDILLKDAAELILKEFNLYYVQVYLVDPSQTTLKLEAGTGSVGAQLVGRGHSLPLNTGSINGRAATEKRSVVIADTAQSATFRQNPLLPDTRGEMAIPLIVANKVVGVLDMQSSHPGALTEEILPAFEALAGQLAVAVQNANLLAETEQARAQVESQARRLVQQGWNEHLDAIHKPEQIGFVFDHNEVTPLANAEETQRSENAQAVVAPISVTGESLGSLVVEIDNEAQREQTNELVSVVARQVAQQIENLRLLESAERYRYEAEQASRRLTREGWQTYTEKAAESLKYIYDLNQVRPLNGDKLDAAATVPLKVRDEVIGKFAIQGLDTNDSEAINLANAVAERLSVHIEGLRQQDQTQSALVQSERLFNASENLTQTINLQDLTATSVKVLNIRAVDRALLGVFEHNSAGELQGMTVAANWWNGTGHPATDVGTYYSADTLRVLSIFTSPTPVFINDMLTDDRVDAATRELVKRLKVRAIAGVPLFIESRQIGSLILESEEVHNFDQGDIRLLTSLAPQIATILESRRQFEQAQKQAKREAMLNVINQKIQSATSVEAVLQIAARELGHALGAPMTVAQLSMKDKAS